jgi:hypothetical protein
MLNFCGIVATGRNFSMLNFYRQYFMPCFGSHFENGRHLENFEHAELRVGVTIESYGKVEISYINVDNF